MKRGKNKPNLCGIQLWVLCELRGLILAGGGARCTHAALTEPPGAPEEGSLGPLPGWQTLVPAGSVVRWVDENGN